MNAGEQAHIVEVSTGQLERLVEDVFRGFEVVTVVRGDAVARHCTASVAAWFVDPIAQRFASKVTTEVVAE